MRKIYFARFERHSLPLADSKRPCPYRSISSSVDAAAQYKHRAWRSNRERTCNQRCTSMPHTVPCSKGDRVSTWSAAPSDKFPYPICLESPFAQRGMKTEDTGPYSSTAFSSAAPVSLSGRWPTTTVFGLHMTKVEELYFRQSIQAASQVQPRRVRTVAKHNARWGRRRGCGGLSRNKDDPVAMLMFLRTTPTCTSHACMHFSTKISQSTHYRTRRAED